MAAPPLRAAGAATPAVPKNTPQRSAPHTRTHTHNGGVPGRGHRGSSTCWGLVHAALSAPPPPAVPRRGASRSSHIVVDQGSQAAGEPDESAKPNSSAAGGGNVEAVHELVLLDLVRAVGRRVLAAARRKVGEWEAAKNAREQGACAGRPVRRVADGALVAFYGSVCYQCGGTAAVAGARDASSHGGRGTGGGKRVAPHSRARLLEERLEQRGVDGVDHFEEWCVGRLVVRLWLAAARFACGARKHVVRRILR